MIVCCDCHLAVNLSDSRIATYASSSKKSMAERTIKSGEMTFTLLPPLLSAVDHEYIERHVAPFTDVTVVVDSTPCIRTTEVLKLSLDKPTPPKARSDRPLRMSDLTKLSSLKH